MAENCRTCAACGTPNEEDARFCEGCGASLSRECATCGVEASATARFCRGCGAPLDGQVAAASPDLPDAGPARKTVTVMFADLAGSTTFEENVDAETAREVIGRYHELLRSTAEHHRAGVTKYIGDGFMAVWGVPEIGPDDAAHAIDAAVELQERFIDLAAHVTKTHGAELALRVAVNTGEVVVGAGDADLVGDALNVGARLEAECPRGRVVVGEETWRATRGRYGYESLGQVQVKGRSAPVAVYQWLGRQANTADAAPFVGRPAEVRRLQAVLDDTIASRAARLVSVIGDPGVGKSRLAAEFKAAHGDMNVIQARCAVERTVALGPIVEVLQGRNLETDIPPTVPERERLLRDLNGLTTGVAGSVEENFWALRRFIEVLAANSPVLLVLDDIQWAGTLLLDFIEHLLEWAQEVPVLVLALARPEIREIRPDLVTVSRWVSEAVPLTGLDARATAELAANVLGAAELPDDLLGRLPSSTGGNPLFVRELIGMLAHDGVLVEQPGGWRLTIDVDAIAIPPTIHALLASRLERVDGADRRVLEIASVVGTDFSVGTVCALAGAGAERVRRALDRLRRLELAQPSGAYVGDEPVWRFHHVLIRDVAYRRMLKSDRADLHERLADWVASGGASVAFDTDEMIARHLEAAYTYRLELGRVNDHNEDLALRAARHYSASARRALDRDELVSAGTQAARGAALANAEPSVHADLLLTGCEAYLSAGDVAAGASLVDELERISDDALEPWASCYRCQFIVYTAPERLLEVDARLQFAIDEFGSRTDPAGLAKAHRVRASARFRLGRVGDAEVDLFEALIAARQSGDHRQITAALGAAPGAALWGPSPVPKAGGRCLDVVRMQRMTTAAPSLEATSMRHLAVLELLRGRPDKARTMLADARQIVSELGLRHGLMETELFAGIIESMEGDPVAAEPHFRTALEGLDALGVGADAGQAAALLARSVLAQGRVDEADRHATESERLAGRNLKTAISWRAVRAEILAVQGHHDEAAAMAQDAVSVAAGTDLVLDHAEACLALSRVLGTAGDTKGAESARSDAEKLYTAKEVAAAVGRGAEPVVASAVPSVAAEQVATASRLAVTNQSCEIASVYISAMRAGDVDGAIACYADPFAYDDRRHISGEPVIGRVAMREALTRVLEQFTHFDSHVLAVRGQYLHLLWVRVSDDDGNETTTLHVNEIDDDERIVYQIRFDEDDFEGAYRELEKRYYEGEGAAFTEGGALYVETFVALNRGDYDRVFGELCIPAVRIENRSRSAFPDRSANELRSSWGELDALTSSSRTWPSAIRWLSPQWSVARLEREAVGDDGERYTWAFLLVGEAKDGRTASMCQFDLEDEDGAFAYAEERMWATASRLAITNQSCEFLPPFTEALRVHDVDGVVAAFADGFVYDDRRRLSGDPIAGREAMRAAVLRIFQQYNHFEFRVMAVRGQRLNLLWSRWTDDDGNETTTLYVNEIDDESRVFYHGRFDEEDFDSAYRELDRRYYAGEGAVFAASGDTTTEWTLALNRGDFDALFDELTALDLVITNRSRSAFPDRSVSEYRGTLEQLAAMVTSSRSWSPAMCWLSPTCTVARCERVAIGKDGEEYTWCFVIVWEVRDGRVASMCEFDVEDEDEAFAYAEERVRTSPSRLAVTNRSTECLPARFAALRVHDVDRALGYFADEFVYEDHRRLSGDPVVGLDAMGRAAGRVFGDYTRFDYRVLAARGQRLHLLSSCWSDDDGNETTNLHVEECSEDGLVVFWGRFDEDDFESAYRELERRYYAGEGAPFAEAGEIATEFMVSLNRGDFEHAFGQLTYSDFRLENRSQSVFGDRHAAEFRATQEDLSNHVASTRTWLSIVHWLTPHWNVSRLEREAVGHDGELYAWTRVNATEVRDGVLRFICEFDLDDEAEAFAYAEERVRATTSRLAVTNSASETSRRIGAAMNTNDLDGASACVSDRWVFDDRRRLGGSPPTNPRSALAQILAQYSKFEIRTLAVRGDRLQLIWSRWSDDSGNETTHFHVQAIDDSGLLIYEGRFDEDDFGGAYRELERRYYAGEGAAYAEAGAIGTEVTLAVNNDLDRAFSEYFAPDVRLENRSRSGFPDRSAAEFRASLEELYEMVDSARTWDSAVCWVSPTCAVNRQERHAVGRDGEQFAWTRLMVSGLRDGQVTSICEFDVDDEKAAFAYAEERLRATSGRLPVTNRASQAVEALGRAMQAHDIDRTMACTSDDYEYYDHRRLSGAPVRGRAELRSAFERIFDQYNRFEGRVLGVRGDKLSLSSSRWSDDAGNQTAYLHVFEIANDGKLINEGRFDEDDFDGAYRELEERYYSGEGAEFAAAGSLATEYTINANQGNLDRVFGDLSAPDLRVENRTRTGFPDRSITEFRASMDDLNDMVASVRTWSSVICWLSPTSCVARLEREAIGLSGEQFSWTWVVASNIDDGRVASMCAFELDDEDSAFAYAEEHAQAIATRLAVTNSATQQLDALLGAARARDADAMANCYAEGFVYDDRRRLSGDPIRDLRATADQILSQYSHFEGRNFAVRGKRLQLAWCRWASDSGFETTHLIVNEIGEDGRFIYEGRFDEEDFESAYRELERRYYAGEGAEFAEAGTTPTEVVIALNRGDFDKAFGEFVLPDAPVENRSRLPFPNRSAGFVRASFAELETMVASTRTWFSAVRWVSKVWSIVRFEREAMGKDGEQFAWTHIVVLEIRDGRITSMCEFELADEAAAFAYAEEQVRLAEQR